MSDAAASFAPILGRVPSGVYVLAVRHDEQETGMLASWVMQAGFNPPMLSLAVSRERFIAEWLTEGAPFVLNVVAAGQKSILSHFARGYKPGEEAFQGMSVRRSAGGTPILADALGYLECEIAGHVDSGDHRVFLARITAGELLQAAGEPMVHVRSNGMRY